MKQSKNGLKEDKSKPPKFVYYSVFKAYIVTWRRALLQVVKAEERIVLELKELQYELDSDENPDLRDYIKRQASIISRNTEHKKLAWLQVVRYIEKHHISIKGR